MRKPGHAIAAILVVALSGHAVAQPAPAPSKPKATDTAQPAPAPAPAPNEPPATDTAQPAPATAPIAPPSVPPAQPAPAAAVPAPAPPSFGPPSQANPPAAEPRQPSGRRLSEGTALGISLGTTLVSWTAIYLDTRGPQPGGVASNLGFLGMLLGPSFGHWYGGAFFTRGMLLRTVGTGVSIFAISLDCEGESCDRFERWALGGLALVLLGSIDDIITAPLRVRAHNRSLQDVALVPAVMSRSAGLALSGRF